MVYARDSKSRSRKGLRVQVPPMAPILPYYHSMKTSSTFTTALIGLIAGTIGAYITLNVTTPSKEELIRDFYLTENAVHVSPHGIRQKIAEGNQSFLLVDLRSAEEYQKEHIVGAVSIPAYKDPDHSAYDEVDRIVGEFKKLPQDKEIIVYCYSMPCMTGRKIGLMLTEHDIYVKHLGIGWNEWRHFWQLWNHEHEWAKTNVNDFVANGTEPGVYTGETVITPCIEGQFGC